MNPKHVLDFVDFKIAEYQKKHDINKAEYDKYKAEYEAKWYNKLFGFKYTGLWDFWAWCRYSCWIDDLNEIKREALYRFKMDYMTMNIPDEWHKHFYKWAEDNKIPY